MTQGPPLYLLWFKNGIHFPDIHANGFSQYDNLRVYATKHIIDHGLVCENHCSESQTNFVIEDEM